ncbi:hypothetical protein ST47_g2495 [Ascochyta rabiei]|uniref:Uncharacterized protein n=1 Tax=Didymella rabiei TaxID=5454 RepID=A0A163JHF9_DIDRA|nr:hypothetical protein ST47_g2495 [Ascochyta rabiei]
MGSPAGVKNVQNNWEPVDGWGYPDLRDVLPKNLKHLKINKTEFNTPDTSEGPAGVQTALRTGVIGLPRSVMELLGLEKEWLHTDEAKTVLFGEEVYGDALRRPETSCCS